MNPNPSDAQIIERGILLLSCIMSDARGLGLSSSSVASSAPQTELGGCFVTLLVPGLQTPVRLSAVVSTRTHEVDLDSPIGGVGGLDPAGRRRLGRFSIALPLDVAHIRAVAKRLKSAIEALCAEVKRRAEETDAELAAWAKLETEYDLDVLLELTSVGVDAVKIENGAPLYRMTLNRWVRPDQLSDILDVLRGRL